MTSAYQQLSAVFSRLSELNHLSAIAHWDEAVMMPPGGGAARANALATLQTLQHEILCRSEVGEWLQTAVAKPPPDVWQQTNLKLMEKRYKSATCLPVDLVKAKAQAGMLTEQAWRKYRAENNWKDFLPLLEKSFKLIKESAIIRGEVFNKDPYDVLLDEYSPDINQNYLNPIFENLKQQLPNLIQIIIQQQKNETVIQPEGNFAVEQQREMGLALMRAIGFDFQHGRLDVSHHPFCGGVPDDVRITTRYNEKEFITAAMGICHETGHACYEQHLPRDWRQQPVGEALGMSVHESQSLLIEMQACRSQEFMEFMAPLAQQQFGESKAYYPKNLFRLYTRVKPNYIRVDADEVTYPLHVILRYEIERELFNGNLQIKDLPDIWNEKMQAYFSLSTQDNYRDGVLQDVHWPAGIFGYFPAYTIGRLIAAQLYQVALRAHPNIPEQLQRGDFSALMSWLNQHIHQRASSVNMKTLLKEATGNDLNAEYFIQHVKQRYLAIN